MALSQHVYNRAVAITASNTLNIGNGTTADLTDAVYVGGAGAFTAVFEDDTTCAFAAAAAGSVLPIRVKRVNSTGLTASNLVALYQR